jgi:hypothetical protein
MPRFSESAITILFLSLISCGGVCADKIVTESISPDGALKATVFIRDCGATTDFSEMVSIHRPDNTFKDDSDLVFVAKGRGQLGVSWAGPRQLSIECDGCQRKDIFREVAKLADIDITVQSR